MRYRGHEDITIPLVTERRGLALVERGIAVSIGRLYWLPHFALGEPSTLSSLGLSSLGSMHEPFSQPMLFKKHCAVAGRCSYRYH